MEVTCSMEWWNWLKAAGIVRDGDEVTRVVIDLRLDEVATVYVERQDTAKLLALAPPSIGSARVEWSDGTVKNAAY